jgi:hypothetical protein
MEKYFDGFLYLANWGTHEVILRLPAGCSIYTARRNCPVDTVSAWASRGNVVL